MDIALPCRAVAPADTRPVPWAWAHDGDHLRACELALGLPPDLAVLTRLLSLFEADLDVPARVALCHALRHHHQGLDAADQQAARAWMDGRFAPCLDALQPAGSPAAVAALARLHLNEANRALWSGHVPQAPVGTPPWSPDFVIAWYADHRVNDPLVAEPTWGVAERWPLLAAMVLAAPTRAMDPALGAQLEQACVALAERDPAFLPAGLALLCELAVRQGQGIVAGGVLAECLSWGAAPLLRAQALCAWLCPGMAEAGLSAPVWQDVLRPERLADPVYRGWMKLACMGTSAQVSWSHFEARLEAAGCPPAVPSSWPHQGWTAWHALLRAQDPVAAPDAQAHEALASAWQRGLEQGVWSGPGQAAVQLALAQLCPEHGAQRFIHLMHARALGAPLATVCAMQRDWLLAHGQVVAADVVGGPDPLAELNFWEGLLPSSWQMVREAALAMLAWWHTEGCWQPCWQGRHPDLPRAEGLWRVLSAMPAWAGLAAGRQQSAAFTVCRPLWQSGHGRTHLWRPSPGSQRVMIVFACVESHHQFASVPSLVAGLPDHNLLFIHNPELNWYSDAAFDEVCALITERLGSSFEPGQVTCYYGSMGGYGALRVAAHFGFRAVVFNPQIDLDLWAAYRPLQRQQILASRQRVNLQDLPVAQWARTPVYLMVGSSTADRSALNLWIEQVQRVQHGDFIIEKFADAHHAGLIQRASGGRVLRTVLAAEARLTQLQSMSAGDAPGWTPLSPALAPALWAQLAALADFKIELRVRAGRLWVCESRRCGTRDVA